MPTDLENSTDDETQSEDSTVIKGLRKQAERVDAAEADAVAARRELTLHKAGLGDLSDKQLKALGAAHEGDWEPELLKATATELGFVRQPGEAETTPQIPAAELEAHQRVANAASGELPPPTPDLTAAIKAAQSQDELVAILRNAGRIANYE